MLSIYRGRIDEIVKAIERVGTAKSIILVNHTQVIDEYISSVRSFMDFRRADMKLYTAQGQEILFFVVKSSHDIDKLSGLRVSTVGYETNSMKGLSLVQTEYIERRVKGLLKEVVNGI